MRAPLIAALLCATQAVAATAQEKARAEYDAGVESFRSKDFDTALQHFDRAYKLDPSPILIYNLARAHEEMGHAGLAIEHYQLYLDRSPDASDRADVERRVRVMSAIIEQGRSGHTASGDASTTGAVLGVYAYGALGLGVAGVAAGIGLGMAAGAAESDHSDATTGSEKKRAADDAERYALGANVSYAIGSVLLATGVTLLVLDGAPAPVALTPAPGGVALVGRF